MGDAAGRRARHDVTGTQRMLFLAEERRSFAVEHHEDLLLCGVVVRRGAEHPSLDAVVVDAGLHRAGRDSQVAAVDEHVPSSPILLLDFVDVDDPSRARARLRQLGIAERILLLPLVRLDHPGPEHPHPSRLQAGEERVLGLGARAEDEIVDPLPAGDDRMRLGACEVDETVAGADLVGLLAVAIVLPGQTGACEHEEDLLLCPLHVQRRRARAGVDLDAVDADSDRAGGPAEIGPGRAERALVGAERLDFVPVHHVLGHAATLCNRRDSGVVGFAAAFERVGSGVGALALGVQPRLAFAQQFAHLGQQLLRPYALPLERLDPLEPVHDCARFVHTPNLAAESGRDCARRVSKALLSPRGPRLRAQLRRRTSGVRG